MVIDRMRQRHQHRRPPRAGEFRDGGGAGPRDDQMRHRQTRRDVAEEGGEVGRHPGFPIRRLDPRQILGPRLLRHHQALAQRFRQQRHRGRHDIGEDARAQAAAQHEEADRPFLRRRRVAFLRQCREGGAHGVADHLRMGG